MCFVQGNHLLSRGLELPRTPQFTARAHDLHNNCIIGVQFCVIRPCYLVYFRVRVNFSDRGRSLNSEHQNHFICINM